MLDSLRARLLLWYALIVTVIILSFAATVCFLFWRSLIEETDRDLRSVASVIEAALQPTTSTDFDFNLPRQYREVEFVGRSPHTHFVILNSHGELIDRSDADVPADVPLVLGARTRSGQRELAVSAANGAVVWVGRDLSPARYEVIALAVRIAAAGSVALLLSLLGGWFLGGRALAPIDRISRAAMMMSRGDLSARIPIAQTESELEQLASTLNEAFDRLVVSVEAQRRFTADASHELRTPLAAMAAQIEWALARPRDLNDYYETIQTCQRATTRMRGIIDDLLRAGRNDGEKGTRQLEPVNLCAVTQEVIGMLQPVAALRHVELEVADTAPAWIAGEVQEIGALLTNLIKNAIEYSHEAGRVTIGIRVDAQAVHYSVSDVGIGITPGDLPLIFERFYRADRARTVHTAGTGLGLAIAKRIVEDHGGAIVCHSEIGKGTTVSATFPRIEFPTPPHARSI